MQAPRTSHALSAALLACCASSIAAQTPLLRSASRAFHTGNQVLADAYRPQHTATGDLDGDGHADLVIAHAGNLVSPKVSVMFNRKDGTFGDPVTYAAPGQTMEAVVADLDADGDLDAAFAQSDNGSAGSRVLVYENDGSGALLPFVSYTVGTGPTGLVAADVDVDGDLDLVSANFFWRQEDVSVLYNDGSGAFPTRADFAIPGENPIKVAAGDLNGDGAPELVVSLDGGSPGFAVLTNDGAGAFGGPALFSVLSVPYLQADVAVADIDLDGDNDVLYGTAGPAVTGGPDGFALYRNDGTGALGALESVDLGPSFSVLYDFAVADVTGDGWPDVLGTERISQEGFVVVPGDGAGGFAAATTFRSGEYARAVTTDDVDGDGDLDAIVTNHASLTVTVHRNDGAGLSTPPLFPIDASSYEVAVGDVDQDGDLDLVSGDAADLHVLVNQGAGTFVQTVQPNPGAKLYNQLCDLDGDGFPDALFAGAGLVVALNDGAGTFGPGVIHPLYSAIGDLATLDMDNDGDLDAVVTGRSFPTDGFFTYENDGSGSFAAPVFTGSSGLTSATTRLATGDFDGDGNADIVTGTWRAAWFWPGDGAGGFGAPIVRDFGTGGTAYLTAGDLDGDGNLDLAGSDWGSAPEGETLTVVFGNGDGSFTTPLTYRVMFSQWRGGVGGLDCGDVDGDGDLDLVGGCRGADDVAVFLNNGDRTFAAEQRYGVDGDVSWLVTADLDGNGRADVAANVANSSSEGGGVTVLLDSASAPFLDLGLGLAGSGGVPTLVGSGIPRSAAPIALELRGAAPRAPSFLVISRTRVDLPVLGGTLVPAPDSLTPFVTSVGGGFTFTTSWPTGLPMGATFFAQAWTLDAPAVTGVSASNALQANQQQ